MEKFFNGVRFCVIVAKFFLEVRPSDMMFVQKKKKNFVIEFVRCELILKFCGVLVHNLVCLCKKSVVVL